MSDQAMYVVHRIWDFERTITHGKTLQVTPLITGGYSIDG